MHKVKPAGLVIRFPCVDNKSKALNRFSLGADESSFVLVNQSLTRKQAAIVCGQAGLELAAVISESEQLIICELGGCSGNAEYWVGGEKAPGSKDWRWPDGSPMTFSYFADDSFVFEEELCTVVSGQR